MARFNTALTSSTITGAATISTPYSGAFTDLTGTAPYTVTLPSPTLFPGVNQTFYNSTSGQITLSVSGATFGGTGGSGTATFVLNSGNVVSIFSNGTNYVVISEDGSPLTATTGSFSGNVTINGGSATLSVTPQTVTLNPTGASTIDNINIGATTRGSGAFNTLTANQAVTFTANTASSGTGTGSLVVTGGVGVSGTVYAGAFNGNLTGTLQTAAQPNITSTGALTAPSLTLNGVGTSRVTTTDASGLYLDANTSAGMYLQSDGAFFVRGSAGTSYGERLRITSTGIVGVGETNPALYGKFVIRNDTTGGAGSSAASTLWLLNANTTANNASSIFFGDSGTAAAGGINLVKTDHTNKYGLISFDTRGTSGYATRMTIDPNGNIGINSATPATYGKLDIYQATDPGTTPAALSIRLQGTGGGSGVQYGINIDASQSYNNSTPLYGIKSVASQNTGQTTYGVHSTVNPGNSNTPRFGVYGKSGFNSDAVHGLTNSTLPVGVYGEATNASGTTQLSTSAAGYFLNSSTLGAVSLGVYIKTTAGPTSVVPLRIDHGSSEIMRLDSTGKLQINGSLSSYNESSNAGAIATSYSELVTTPINLGAGAGVDVGKIPVTTATCWKAIVRGTFSNNYDGGGLTPPAFYIELNSVQNTIPCGGTSITVARNATTDRLRFTNTSGTYTVAFTGTVEIIVNTQSGQSSRSITTIGAVGVGTNAPAAQLHVLNTGGSTNSPNTALILDYQSNSTALTGAGTAIEFRGKSSGGNIANYSQARIRSTSQDTNNAHGMAFDYKPNAATALTEAMSIDAGGTLVLNGSLSQTGVRTRSGTFSLPSNSGTVITVSVSNYSYVHFKFYALRTNGGNSMAYWDGIINNNNNTTYANAIAQSSGAGAVNFTVTVGAGFVTFTFNFNGSGGYGYYICEDMNMGSISVAYP